MLASLLSKYNIKHNISGLPPPGDKKVKSPLISKLEKTQNLLPPNPKGDPSLATFAFSYVHWDQFLRVYIDDLIFGVPKDHEDTSTLMPIITILVLHALQEVGFIVSGSKVSLEHSEFKFLGVTINTDTNYSLITDDRVQAIVTWRQPRNVAETNFRLATLNYYSNYLVELKLLAIPLAQMVKSDVFTWDQSFAEARNNIKFLMFLAIKNYTLDPNRPLLISTDASKIAASYCAWQVDETGLLNPIKVNTRMFSKGDINKGIQVK